MVELEKTVHYCELFALYGKLLSFSQQRVLTDYYENDLTLSEIAENNGTTRQAVYDAVVKAQQKLFLIEKKVGAFKQIRYLKEKLNGNF